jgi:hypothetical protein
MLLLALNAPGHADDSIARHVRGCKECQTKLTGLRRVIGDVAAAAGTTKSERAGPCLDELELAALAEGGEALAERPRAHLAECGHCRRELAELTALLADPTVVAAIDDRPRVSRLRWWRVAGGALAAAAAVVLVVALPKRDRPDAAAHRAPTITAAETPALRFPVGDVDEARSFLWGAVAGANRYRLTLFDAAGHVLLATQGTDTLVALPDSIVPVRGRSYLWKVEARTAADRWTSSELIEFRIGERRAP